MKHFKRIMLTMLVVSCCACTKVQTPPYQADVVYGHKDGMALFYDVFNPSGESNGAGIVYMVSGGWFSRWQAPEQRVEQFAQMTDAGYTVFAVHHGSAPRYTVPEAYADVSRAIRHIRANADQFGIDPNRLGVTGGSAGGHLSLMIGTNSDNGQVEADDTIDATGNRVAAVVAYFPPVDLRQMAGNGGERFPALDFERELAAGISPLLMVSSDDPPTLLLHGDADTLVNISHSEQMYAALQGAGVESEFIIYEGGDHGFRNPEHRQQAAAARLEWFNRYLLP
ncbi:MAG: alpha/beta hydrolase [Cellvibrionaceae bacterium]